MILFAFFEFVCICLLFHLAACLIYYLLLLHYLISVQIPLSFFCIFKSCFFFRLYIIKKSFSINETIESCIFIGTLKIRCQILKINTIMYFFNFPSSFRNKILEHVFLLTKWYTSFFFFSKRIRFN